MVGPATSAGGGGGVTLDFQSDYGSATIGDTTDANLLDGNKWTELLGNTSQKAVVSTSGLGFPTGISKAMRIQIIGTQSSEVAKTGLTQVPIGGDRYWRANIMFDFSNAPRDLASAAHHPIENYFGACPNNWEFKFGYVQSTGRCVCEFVGTGKSWKWGGNNPVMQTNVPYQFEWAYQNRDSSDVYNIDIRVRNAAGTLIATSDDFLNGLGNTMTSDTPHTATLTTGDDCVRRMQMGTNGPTTGFGGNWEDTETNNCYMYITGVASSMQTWIGAYVPGEHT